MTREDAGGSLCSTHRRGKGGGQIRSAQAIVNRSWSVSHINVHGRVTVDRVVQFLRVPPYKDAQPEMRALADAMWEAREAATPKLFVLDHVVPAVL